MNLMLNRDVTAGGDREDLVVTLTGTADGQTDAELATHIADTRAAVNKLFHSIAYDEDGNAYDEGDDTLEDFWRDSDADFVIWEGDFHARKTDGGLGYTENALAAYEAVVALAQNPANWLFTRKAGTPGGWTLKAVAWRTNRSE